MRPGRVEHPRALALIAAASLLWALCYPPFPLGPLAFLALAPLFAALGGLSPGQAFRYAFAGGILYNTVMYWWIYNVVKVGPGFIIGAGLVVLILFLSLFNGVLGWLFRVLSRRPWGLAAFPLAWAGLEVLRTWGQMSFPWSHMGYALGHHLALIQAASFLGVFGLSALVVASNVLLYLATPRRFHGLPSPSPSARYALVAAAAAIPAGLWMYGGLALSKPLEDDRTLDIALVQPSIPQTKKWDEHYFQEVMQKTWRTMGVEAESPGDADSASAGRIAPDAAQAGKLRGADLIVLPETAVPDFLRSRGDVQAALSAIARRSGADLVVGALDFVPDDKPYRAYQFFNSAFLFPAAETRSEVRQYSKLRLVPFSERLPFDDIFPLINYVNLGEGDFSTGAGYSIWGDSLAYAPSICYEIIYPDYVRGARRAGASLMVNITNDGWFGYSNAPFQHANITRFRAVEVGIPIARSANSGISIFYDARGRILGKTSLFEETVLRRKLSLATRETAYFRVGDAMETGLAGIFILAVMAAFVLSWKRRPAPSPRPAAVAARP
jgi:apolipoprotein N-acyltransferase